MSMPLITSVSPGRASGPASTSATTDAGAGFGAALATLADGTAAAAAEQAPLGDSGAGAGTDAGAQPGPEDGAAPLPHEQPAVSPQPGTLGWGSAAALASGFWGLAAAATTTSTAPAGTPALGAPDAAPLQQGAPLPATAGGALGQPPVPAVGLPGVAAGTVPADAVATPASPTAGPAAPLPGVGAATTAAMAAAPSAAVPGSSASGAAPAPSATEAAGAARSATQAPLAAAGPTASPLANPVANPTANAAAAPAPAAAASAVPIDGNGESAPAPVVAAVGPAPVSNSALTGTASLAQPGLPAAPVPLATQLARPLFTLAAAGDGTHHMTITVNPERLGPVTVQAVVAGDQLRIELFAPSDVARDAVRGILGELRRDLAGTGLHASLNLSGDDAPARQGAGNPGGQNQAGQNQPGQNTPGQHGSAQQGAVPREEPVVAARTLAALQADEHASDADLLEAAATTSAHPHIDLIA
ncbi:flagellar hook-length control protein FliK [Microterricola viridarii]|uniref:Flagellar hook-length control protein FliK n=1 Tax=Microterricola viridarii TaxID=412690 RepID=A0A1H1W3Y1_9MICO|nr:flagellar hook-length control protein FliK [Microterricola viridarii]SDS91847.1 flagellar hook-length control protein FliK [Microterricola viridarii]